MTKWIIEACDLVMGAWEAETKEEALDAYARDAGYDSFEDLSKHVPGKVKVYAWDEYPGELKAKLDL